MRGIHEFFKKIKNVHMQEVFVRTAVCDVIKKHLGANFPLESVTFPRSNRSIVEIKNIGSAARSALFIKKQAILAEINAAQTIRVITDIK